jgi:cation diffusion facilitator family transporter
VNHCQCRESTDHSFGEKRTAVVSAVAILTMGAEIAAGVSSGSMALLADGLHMASHTIAFGVALFAYRYARKHALNPQFTFGTGKVNALGGFTGATMLGFFAVWMAWESAERFFNPGLIHYSEAMLVAAIGLAVNVGSALLLKGDHHYHHHSQSSGGACEHHDHNLQAAYLHVLADAAISLAAIVALFVSQRWNAAWLDPLIGVTGALVIGSWSVSLLKTSSSTLLDHEGPGRIQSAIAHSIESEDVEIADWHCWAIAPGRYAAILSIVAHSPQTIQKVKSRIPIDPSLVHLTVEIYQSGLNY